MLLMGATASLLTFLVFRAERLVLRADRVERIGLWRARSLRRDEILGFRRLESEVLLFDRAKACRLTIPLYAFKNPEWRAWIEGCRNLEIEEINDALKAAEANPDLGHNVADRRRTLDQRLWMTRGIIVLMVGLFAWTIVWPRPSGLPVYLSSAAPFVAIVLSTVRRDLFAILSGEQVSTRIDLSTMFLGATGPALVAMNLPLADWWQPLLVATLIGVVFALLTLRLGAEMVQQHWVIGAIIGLTVLASSWGGMLALNQALDDQPPMLVRATVLGTHWSKGRPTLDVEIGGPRPFRMSDVRVSGEVFRAFEAGADLCAGVYPGLFGWRSVRLVKCEAVVQLPQSPRL
ncbi:MAG: hypothetical protein ACK4FG_05945 [Brevundimonas sp.]